MRRNPGCEYPQPERRSLLNNDICDRDDGNGDTPDRGRTDGTPSEARLLAAALGGAEWQAKLRSVALPPDPYELATLSDELDAIMARLDEVAEDPADVHVEGTLGTWVDARTSSGLTDWIAGTCATAADNLSQAVDALRRGQGDVDAATRAAEDVRFCTGLLEAREESADRLEERQAQEREGGSAERDRRR